MASTSTMGEGNAHPILGQTICEFYTSSNTQHAKNERMYAITWLILSFNK
jgi:hypothetical protein